LFSAAGGARDFSSSWWKGEEEDADEALLLSEADREEREEREEEEEADETEDGGGTTLIWRGMSCGVDTGSGGKGRLCRSSLLRPRAAALRAWIEVLLLGKIEEVELERGRVVYPNC
jgi:hypothetical protein